MSPTLNIVLLVSSVSHDAFQIVYVQHRLDRPIAFIPFRNARQLFLTLPPWHVPVHDCVGCF